MLGCVCALGYKLMIKKKNYIVPAPTYVITNGDRPLYPSSIIKGGELLLTTLQAFADYQHYVTHIRERIIDTTKTMESADPELRLVAAQMLRKEWRYLKMLKE